MQLNLSPETENWLTEQVKAGNFASFEAAIDYSVKLTCLRETLLSSLADPRRFTADQVRGNLKDYFAGRRKEAAVS